MPIRALTSQNDSIGSTGKVSISKASANSSSLSAGCPHVKSHIKLLVDRLKVLAPYSIICSKRHTLLLGRRGFQAANSVSGSALPNSQELSNSLNKSDIPLSQQTTSSSNLEGDRSRKRLAEEMPSPLCDTCCSPLDRIHACLECDFYGCWKSKANRLSTKRDSPHSHGHYTTPHIIEHLNHSKHNFAVDFYHMQIYCNICKDYIYDPTMLSWLRGMSIRWYAALCDSAEPEAKRPRIIGVSIDITPQEARFAKEHATVRPCGGLRGLLNLGATCYLNVIVQAIFQNPLIRGWLLSGGHTPNRCKVGRNNKKLPSLSHSSIKSESTSIKSNGTSPSIYHTSSPKGFIDTSNSTDLNLLAPNSASLDTSAAAQVCIGCQLYELLLSYYSGDSTPINCSKLLHALWVLRPDMAGYGQQDAHECFIAILDQLHTCLIPNTTDPALLITDANSNADQSLEIPPLFTVQNNVSLMSNSTCSCIVHQTFGGILQSTVVCSGCGNVTVSNDPVLDLSLDIRPNHHKISKSKSDSLLKNSKLYSNSSNSLNSSLLNKTTETDNNNNTLNDKSEAFNYSAYEAFSAESEQCKTISEIDFELRKAYNSRLLLKEDHIFKRSNTPDLDEGITTSDKDSANFKNNTLSNNCSINTLQKCLEQFTHPEILSNGMYTCSNCESSDVLATKQFSIKQLPPVLSFQLKRFNCTPNSSSKLNDYVRLPLNLDMTPYTTGYIGPNINPLGSYINTNSFPDNTTLSAYTAFSDSSATTNNTLSNTNDPTSNNSNSTNLNNNNNVGSLLANSGLNGGSSRRRLDISKVNPACQYQLFAVVNHTGALDTGHYTLYSQHRNQWFRFDDSSITFADLSEVLELNEESKALKGESAKGSAYMAFYVKQTLDFNDPPSVTSENANNLASAEPSILSTINNNSNKKYGSSSISNKDYSALSKMMGSDTLHKSDKASLSKLLKSKKMQKSSKKNSNESLLSEIINIKSEARLAKKLLKTNFKRDLTSKTNSKSAAQEMNSDSSESSDDTTKRSKPLKDDLLINTLINRGPTLASQVLGLQSNKSKAFDVEINSNKLQSKKLLSKKLGKPDKMPLRISLQINKHRKPNQTVDTNNLNNDSLVDPAKNWDNSEYTTDNDNKDDLSDTNLSENNKILQISKNKKLKRKNYSLSEEKIDPGNKFYSKKQRTDAKSDLEKTTDDDHIYNSNATSEKQSPNNKEPTSKNTSTTEQYIKRNNLQSQNKSITRPRDTNTPSDKDIFSKYNSVDSSDDNNETINKIKSSKELFYNQEENSNKAQLQSTSSKTLPNITNSFNSSKTTHDPDNLKNKTLYSRKISTNTKDNSTNQINADNYNNDQNINQYKNTTEHLRDKINQDNVDSAGLYHAPKLAVKINNEVSDAVD
ncbi:hypothetical protein BB561_004290 [Smittium simulii]|uniref:Uncharacterized protein n=1 Tax=Smittium simulii TaxID=133385 RepID=A0A2T9YH11_9FUNG|nr:hypothetical protein BB561_004290 [Smittium simulii]